MRRGDELAKKGGKPKCHDGCVKGCQATLRAKARLLVAVPSQLTRREPKGAAVTALLRAGQRGQARGEREGREMLEPKRGECATF